jgi:hypothetical protein
MEKLCFVENLCFAWKIAMIQIKCGSANLLENWKKTIGRGRVNADFEAKSFPREVMQT